MTRMTRFWLTLEQGVRFVIRCIEQMRGGEVFVPKIPSTRVIDLAKVIAPQAEIEVIGIRPGEKLHEVLIHEDEARVHGGAGRYVRGAADHRAVVRARLGGTRPAPAGWFPLRQRYQSAVARYRPDPRDCARIRRGGGKTAKDLSDRKQARDATARRLRTPPTCSGMSCAFLSPEPAACWA